MILNITEIQIACTVLMALMAHLLFFTVPRLGKANRVTRRARYLLASGTVLVSLHFLVQYTLHRTQLVTPELRTTLNLVFGTAFAYCFNLSLVYLQRKGRILQKEYWIFFGMFGVVLSLFLFTVLKHGLDPDYLHPANVLMAICMGFTQLYANYLQFREYYRIKHFLQNGGEDNELSRLIRWTHWSMVLMATTGIMLPVMAFIPNLAIRGFYGILSLSAGHFYIFSFIGYHMQHVQQPLLSAFTSSSPASPDPATEPILDADLAIDAIDEMPGKRYETSKLQLIAERMPQLEAKQIYLRVGLTQSRLADALGVSTHILAHYFQTTPYGKFNSWMQDKRIEHAKKLMHDHPDWSNQTVSQACGYANRSHFQTQFLDVTGMSPSRWAQEHQSGVEA